MWIQRLDGEEHSVRVDGKNVIDTVPLSHKSIFVITERAFRFEKGIPSSSSNEASVSDANCPIVADSRMHRPAPPGRAPIAEASEKPSRNSLPGPLLAALESRRVCTDPSGLPNTPLARRSGAPPAPPAPDVAAMLASRPLLPAELAQAIRKRRKSVAVEAAAAAASAEPAVVAQSPKRIKAVAAAVGAPVRASVA
jgi:hypothetical protein